LASSSSSSVPGRQIEGHFADAAHCDAVGDRRRRRHLHALPGLQRALHRRDRVGLDADHANRRPAGLDRQRDAGDEPTAAHRNHHGVEIVQLVEQLETQGSLPGHHPHIVKGMDEHRARRSLDGARPLVRLVVVRPVENDLGAIAAGGGHLDDRRVGRHDDRGRNAEARGVKRHGQPVVAGAGGHHAAAALAVVELQQEIDGAALLERAGHLEVLELEVARAAAQLRERQRVGAGGLVDGTAQPLARGLHGGDVQGRRRGHV
jgi:hypothetical protein